MYGCWRLDVFSYMTPLHIPWPGILRTPLEPLYQMLKLCRKSLSGKACDPHLMTVAISAEAMCLPPPSPSPHVQIYVLAAAAWPRKTLSVVSLRSSTRDVLCAQNIGPYQKSISKPFLLQMWHNQQSENDGENKAVAISKNRANRVVRNGGRVSWRSGG